MASRCEILCEIIVAILLLPPIGVCFRHGCCTVELFTCVVFMTILGYIPGIVYALYAILRVDRDTHRADYCRPLA